MKSLDHLTDQASDLELVKNLLLSVLFIYNFVEFVVLSGVACGIFSCRLTLINSKSKDKYEVKGKFKELTK